MIDIYSQVIKHDENDGFEDFLKKLGIVSIFKEVIEAYPLSYIGIVKFILWGYSLDSDALSVNGNTWSTVSKEIFDRTNLDKDLFEPVCELKSHEVLSCIDKWLRFQNDENFTQFITYRDLRKQMLYYSLAELKKSGGEIDINAKMDAANHSKTLLVMMNEAKETFIQNHPKLRASTEAFNRATDKAKVTKSPASYALS